MGQELLDVRGYQRTRPTYYLATNSKGHKVVRGSTYKKYTHATIHSELYNSGYCYATFTTRLDLAKRYARAWGDKSEVVEVVQITSQQARQYKKEIERTAKEYQELQAQRTAQIYEVEREN